MPHAVLFAALVLQVKPFAAVPAGPATVVAIDASAIPPPVLAIAARAPYGGKWFHDLLVDARGRVVAVLPRGGSSARGSLWA